MVPVTDYFSPVDNFPDGDRKQLKIRHALVSLIVKGNLPLALADNPAFVDFVKTCEPRYSPISRYVFVNWFVEFTFSG